MDKQSFCTKIKKICIYICITLVLCLASFLTGYYTCSKNNASEIIGLRNEYASKNKLSQEQIDRSKDRIERLEQSNKRIKTIYNGLGNDIEGLKHDSRTRIEIIESLLSGQTD